MDNPRFPHTIRITRLISPEGYDPYSGIEIEPTEIYHGEGRNYKNNKTNLVNGVVQSDYAVSIPLSNIDVSEIEIIAGDTIVVTDRSRITKGNVDDAYVGNLGLNVFWTRVNN